MKQDNDWKKDIAAMIINILLKHIINPIRSQTEVGVRFYFANG
jgi:hypothetical protein